MRDTIEMAREVGFTVGLGSPALEKFERLIAMARADERKIVMNEPLTKEMWQRFEDEIRADERMSFYGQDKPAECAEGCPPNQICDYCQVVAPVKAMILAEREACAKVADYYASGMDRNYSEIIADAIRARGDAK